MELRLYYGSLDKSPPVWETPIYRVLYAIYHVLYIPHSLPILGDPDSGAVTWNKFHLRPIVNLKFLPADPPPITPGLLESLTLCFPRLANIWGAEVIISL